MPDLDGLSDTVLAFYTEGHKQNDSKFFFKGIESGNFYFIYITKQRN